MSWCCNAARLGSRLGRPVAFHLGIPALRTKDKSGGRQHTRQARLLVCRPPTARTGSIRAMNSDRPADPVGAARRPHDPHAPSRSERPPDIDIQRCTGCGRCVAVCDPHLLSLEVVRWKKFAVLHEPERCTGCSACAASCPFHAITMRKRAAVG